MKDEIGKIPQATTKRLPLYYRFLKNFANAGKVRISSKELSDAMSIDSATIRRDFSHFGALGKKGYGYDVNHLLAFFRTALDQDRRTHVALVGAGRLGTAFLHYNFQKNHNTRIVVALDKRAPLAGEDVAGLRVYHVDRLEEMLQEHAIEVVILTVPSSAAQPVADRLCEAGVKGILNFSSARISVPPNVRVHTIDLSVEIQTLIYLIREEEGALKNAMFDRLPKMENEGEEE